MNELNIREAIWREIPNRLPVIVVIHQQPDYYSAKDGSGKYIYADDIEDDSLDILFEEWADVIFSLEPGDFIQQITRAIEAMRCGKMFKRVLSGVYHRLNGRSQIIQLSAKLNCKEPLAAEFRFTEVNEQG